MAIDGLVEQSKSTTFLPTINSVMIHDTTFNHILPIPNITIWYIVHGQHYCHYMSIHFSVFSWWTNNLWTNEFWSICLRTHLPGPIHVATGWVGKKHPPRLATRSFKAQAKHKDVTTLKIHIDVGHPLFVDCFPKETMGFPHLCLFT